MEIRKLTPADAAHYRDLRLEALELHPEAFSSAPEDSDGKSLEEWKEELTSTPHRFVLGGFDDDGQLRGMVGFIRNEGRKVRHKGMIMEVFSSPAVRGKGLAKSMLERLIEEARSLPEMEQLQLTVAADNGPARTLYESLGFKPYGLEKESLKIEQEYVDEEHMVLKW
ncbi:GNAT family N-acetyltransferase [Desmospora profundinema]|uniref:RimJ/RimL family protein N-acetyltransferase n=1 Tax=Desmospora profundinema TaxID=1571184 RepID=A0ABU1IPT0_9BACL|nr:GNAT family protein [Desmospora profundinema]MDR6226804.1 RimJ/RimL family protein N-acetyltransferase [Desmospora profundinema]